ncbi:MAG: hypothetical protein QNI91_05435 [Arenicellales bacterium]|nr:hypothetical protein [Arenicellales bacterium]
MDIENQASVARSDSRPWWAITFVLVSLPLILYNYPKIYSQLPEVWIHRRGSFRMIFEMNYPTWWTAILLFAAAMLVYELTYLRQHTSRWALWGLALVIAGLSYDEVGSIHERVSLLSEQWFDSPWTALTPFGIVGLAVLVFGLKATSHLDGGRRATAYIVAGFLTFAFVVLQEYLEHHPKYPKFVYKTFGVTNAWSRWFEEVTEIVGAMLILIGTALARNRGQFSGRLGFVLTKPTNIPNLRTILLVGLVIHCVIAFFFLPDARELTVRGNPAGWYPSAVFFLLFAHAYWQHHSQKKAPDAVNIDKTRLSSVWLVLSVFFILCSIGFLHNYGHVIADAIPGIRKPFYFNLLVIYFSVLASVIGMAFWLGLLSGRRFVYVPLLLSVPLMELFFTDRGVPFAASGIVSYLTACLFLTPCRQTTGRR